jgi:Tol biopolymer transport system component
MMKRIPLVVVFAVVVLFMLSGCAREATEKTMIQVDTPTDIISLQRGYFKGRFSPEGDKLLFTDQSNNGISQYKVDFRELSVFTRSTEAGLEAFYSKDGKSLVYITNDYEERLRLSSLIVLNVEDANRKILLDKVRNVRLVNSDRSSVIFYENDQPREYDLETGQFLPEVSDKTGVFLDSDLSLAVYRNGQSTVINPQGEGNYLWPSLSPNQDKVLYWFSGEGAFISDLEGKKPISLGMVRAPKWTPDGKYVIGMEDQDDGKRYIASDIILVSADGRYRQNLTKDTDIIALYPEMSPDGKTIVFNDDKGRVYLMDVLTDR